MPLGKRKRASFPSRAKRARSTGKTGYAGIMRASVRKRVSTPALSARVNALYRMVETKEAGLKTAVNLAIPHNNLITLFDLFENISQGVADPNASTSNSQSRIGDRISLRGVTIRGFCENALDRSRVHYRVMVLKGAKGDTFDRGTIFKGMADNKTIDQINTERFTIVAQKMFTIDAVQPAPSQVNATGVPYYTGPGGVVPSGISGSRAWKMWIPGNKFTRNGDIQYENGSTQPKFYDYKVLVFAYDWYGTPEGNNVGRVNECYHKVYYKDV